MNPAEQTETRPGTRMRRYAREALSLAAFLLIAFSARSSFADHYQVPSGSMQPTLQIDDHVIVNKAAYGLRVPFTHLFITRGASPARGDVVVLDSPEDGIVLIKRVAAVPGDRVAVREGRVIINGVASEVATGPTGTIETLTGRPHPLSLDAGGGPDLDESVVPQDMFLMLGDNRGNSRDGRFFGFVPRTAVLGRAVAVFLRDGSPVWQRL